MQQRAANSSVIHQRSIRVIAVNHWTKPVRFERVVHPLGFDVTCINPEAAATIFTLDPPDVVLLGFGVGSGKAAAFITDYKSSPWFRRVPLIAAIESRDASLLVPCMRWGCDDAVLKSFGAEQLRTRIHTWALRQRAREVERRAHDQLTRDKLRAEAFGRIIVPLGVAMMAETDFNVLLEMILAEAKTFCRADGGTLYLLENDGSLSFQLLVNDSLGLRYGGTSGAPIPFAPLRATAPADGDSAPVHIATHVVQSGETINVADAYGQHRWDFSGTKAFDSATGYRTTSVLTIPLRNAKGSIVGVLQLLNALDETTKDVVPFDGVAQTLMESLSILAGQALESYRKMHQLRMRADALTIEIDEEEKARQIREITSSDYFRVLKSKASALRTESKQKALSPVP